MSGYKGYLIALAVGAMAVIGIYRLGVNHTEEKYQAIFKEQEQKIEELSKQEVKIEKEIVTVYKDRVRVVKEVETKIVEVIKDVLQEESAACVIGPNFISLHNAAAVSTTIPPTATGTDGATTGTDRAEK
jgi:hypothetical protein